MASTTDIPKVVLEQLEMVRMQGRFNMLDRRGIQVAANDLGFNQLVCFIEDLPRRGDWMPALNALGDFANAMTTADRDALRDALGDLDS